MKTDKKNSSLALKKNRVRNLTVSSGLKAGCDAGCSNPNSGCTNNSGHGIIRVR